MEAAKEACHYLENPDTPSAVNMVFILNNMYTLIDEYTNRAKHGSDTAEFAKALVANIKSRFNPTELQLVCCLSYFDPKVAHLNNVPMWWPKGVKQST